MNALSASDRETAEAYRGELHRLNRWRIALCRDSLQFILQTRVSGTEGDAGARWASRSFCTTRAAVLRLWQSSTGDGGEVLARLPERARMLDLSAWQAAHTNA